LTPDGDGDDADTIQLDDGLGDRESAACVASRETPELAFA